MPVSGIMRVDGRGDGLLTLLRYSMFLLFAALLAACLAADRNRAHDSCTAACDAKAPTDEQTYVFCGTDGATHNTTTHGVVRNDCYAYCGVSVLHVGLCGCPNYCGGPSRGACRGGQCVCRAGWGGPDCLSVVCPAPCGGGTCVRDPAGDYCRCPRALSGPFCDAPVPSLPSPLWSDLVPAPPEYSPLDPYGDLHPIFNLSSLAVIRLSLPDSSLAYLLDPFNLYNASYMTASMTFMNNVIRETDVEVGMKVKGQSTRTNIKKAWDLKFPKKKPFYGLEKLALKNGNGSGPAADSILKMMLESVTLRALNVPVSRTSFAVVYINDKFEGLYYFEETVWQDEFLVSRFGEQYPKDSSLMRFHWHVVNHWEGPDPQTYLSTVEHVFANNTTPYYEAERGNFSDYVAFLQYVNQSLTAPLDYFDSDAFLRLAAVEAFFIQDDNACDGNNWMAFRPSDSKMWTVFTHDYDSVFDPKEIEASRNVYEYVALYHPPPSDWHHINPVRLRAALNGNATFTAALRALLAATFPSQTGALSLPSVYSTFANMVFPTYAVDYLQQFSYGHNASSYLATVAQTISRLEQRFKEVSSQIY